MKALQIWSCISVHIFSICIPSFNWFLYNFNICVKLLFVSSDTGSNHNDNHFITLVSFCILNNLKLTIVSIEEYGKIYIKRQIDYLCKNILNIVTCYNSLTSKLHLSNWLGNVFTSNTHTSQIQSLQGYIFVVLQ